MMTFIVNFVQIFSSLLTVASFVGLFGIPEKLKDLGLTATHIQVVFALSLLIAIASYVSKRKLDRGDVGRGSKAQIQFGGKGNRQKAAKGRDNEAQVQFGGRGNKQDVD